MLFCGRVFAAVYKKANEMTNKFLKDARSDQLNLLKFEKRCLRPMALTILDSSTTRKLKISTIAGVSAMLLTLQGAPEAYASTLGIDKGVVSRSEATIFEANSVCHEIATLIESGGDRAELEVSLEKLFTLIDNEHACMDKLAYEANARLLSGGADNLAGGTGGGNEPLTATNMKWLNFNKNRVS